MFVITFVFGFIGGLLSGLSRPRGHPVPPARHYQY